MASLPALPMSQTKDDLVKHLGMPSEIYTLMAKETDRVYKWLTKDPKHLKSNCKRQPPYDWSDVLEKKKDQAMQHIAESGDARTRCYWDMAQPTPDCPNWIAKWFLYHKFRYRDGRNRSIVKDRENDLKRRHSSHYRDHPESTNYAYSVMDNNTYSTGSTTTESNVQTQYYQQGTYSDSDSYYYYDAASNNGLISPEQAGAPRPKAYDPIRDI